MNPIAKLFVEVGASTNNFKRGMTQVRDEINSTSKQASFFSNAMSTAIGTGLTTVVSKTISSLKENIDWLKRTGEEFNSLKENSYLAFETMLGSGEKASSFLKELTSFAERTPFELPGLIDSAQKMLAFGFTANQVLPTLTAVGDAVSGLGGSPEKLNRVIVAIGQIQAKGKVQAQEMLQLAEAGIPAWEILAKHLGVTIPDAMKLSEKGAIDARTALDALIGGMNQKFGGLMDKQSKTFSGLRSTFNDLMRDVAARVTKPWFDNAKRGLERMIDLMKSQQFQTFIERVTIGSKRIADFVAKIKGALFGLFLGKIKLVEYLFGTKSDLDKTSNALSSIPKKISGWIKYLQPVKDFIWNLTEKGFRLFTSTFDSFYRSFNRISNERFYFFGDMSLGEFSKGIKSIFNDIQSGGKNLNYWLYTAPKAFQVVTRLILSTKNVFKYLSGEGLQSTLKKLWSILSGLGTTLAKLVRPFKDALGGLFAQLSTMKSMGFADIFKAVISSVIQAFTGFIDVIKVEFWPSIKAAFEFVFGSLWEYFSNIDWTNVWNTIKDGFNGLVVFINSINWSSVWSVVWTGLSTVGNWINENVIPVFTEFFTWLISWFSDPSKAQTLSSVITSTWGFISSWASTIVATIEPYLTSFFSWLGSWFTDASKNTQLLQGISTVWNFITEWAGKLVGWISVPLGAFFSWLLSWVTDSNKRGQLWTGISSTWNWVTQWAGSLITWVTPYLSQFWSWLSSWFVDPAKNAYLLQTLQNGWTAIKTWSSGLWNWISPNLSVLGTNLKNWIDKNHPQFGGWVDAFSKTSSQIKDDWIAKWPIVSQVFKEFSETMKTEIPLIIESLNRMYLSIAGEDSDGIAGYFAKAIAFYTRYFSFLTTSARIVTEMLEAMVETTKKAFAFDWNGYVAGSMQFGAKISELMSHLSTLPQLGQGYATGGNVPKSGSYLVGESGPEVVNLPMGSRVWDHGQSRGKVGSGSVAEVRIYNESKFPIDRNTVKEIAQALQRELNLSGNRVVFAN